MNGVRRDSVCYLCRAGVLWATFRGKPIPLERCTPGTGDLAFQQSIEGGEQLVNASGSGWRKHDCAPAAAAGSFSTLGGGKHR